MLLGRVAREKLGVLSQKEETKSVGTSSITLIINVIIQ